MKSIVIISHFLSCNFGDRIQSYHLIQLLKPIKNISITLVNLFPLDNGADRVETNIFDFCVYSYDYVFKNMKTIDNVVMYTGSLGSDKVYNSYCKKILELVQNKFYIIGGFSSDIVNYQNFDYIFNNKKIVFISRTFNELQMFKLLGNTFTKNNIVSESRHGGDLIINVIQNFLSAFRANRKKILHFKKVAILSVYLIKNMIFHKKIEKLNYLLSKTDKIILIDTYADKEVIEYLESIKSKIPVVISYNTETIIANLVDASVVVSSRLHGAVFTCVLGIPTYILPTDNSVNFDIYIPNDKKSIGSFKYQSFLQSALDRNIGFGKLIKFDDLDTFNYTPFAVDNQLIDRYRKLSMDTEAEIIKSII